VSFLFDPQHFLFKYPTEIVDLIILSEINPLLLSNIIVLICLFILIYILLTIMGYCKCNIKFTLFTISNEPISTNFLSTPVLSVLVLHSSMHVPFFYRTRSSLVLQLVDINLYEPFLRFIFFHC